MHQRQKVSVALLSLSSLCFGLAGKQAQKEEGGSHGKPATNGQDIPLIANTSASSAAILSELKAPNSGWMLDKSKLGRDSTSGNTAVIKSECKAIAEVQVLQPPKRAGTKLLFFAGAVLTGLLGYVRYACGSTPRSDRDRFQWARWGSKLFQDQQFVKGDYTAMQNWTVIHAVNLSVGAAAIVASSAKFGLSSLLPLAAPAAFLVGTAGCLSITSRHGSRDTHPFLVACKWGSVAALGVFACSKLHLLNSVMPVAPETLAATAIGTALLARSLGLVGFTWKYIKAALHKTETFPQLVNMALWTASAGLGAAAVPAASSQAAWVPLGYFAQNAAIMGIALCSYGIWRWCSRASKGFAADLQERPSQT